MTTTTTNFSALSRMFSSSVYRQLAEKGRSPLFSKLLQDTGLLDTEFAFNNVSEAFDAAFATLRKVGQRDEYVYRAALTHNILLGRHSLKTASLLTEFRAGSCKADLAILNGTATVYEVKSERDSLSRLENQIHNYRKVFAKIYVVVAEKFVAQVIEKTSQDIGIMSLERWDRIKTVREAIDLSNHVCPVSIFESLRISEAKDILENLGIEVPTVPNTKIHAVMREFFSHQDPATVHNAMVTTLKRTRNLASLESLLENIPMSLQPAALSIQVRRSDHERLINSLKTPIDQAIGWT